MAGNANRSEAYDLSLFEPRQAKLVALTPNKKLQKMERRRARVQAVLNAVFTTLAAGAIVTVLTLLVTTQVQLTEINSSINTQQSRLDELKSEQTRLEAELAQKLSAQSVDEYAQQKGMTAVEGSQIHYITRDNTVEEEPAEGPANWWEALLDSLSNFFS